MDDDAAARPTLSKTSERPTRVTTGTQIDYATVAETIATNPC